MPMAARVIGMNRGQILRLEIVPNLVPLIVTLLAVEMGIAILVEVILSFVGISVAGDTATWGGMIAEGRQIIYQSPWIMALADRMRHRQRGRVQSSGGWTKSGTRPGTAPMTAVLSVQDLHVAIGKGATTANVLRGVSLEVQPGEVRGLVGESGAGKSMLGRAVLGLLPANAHIERGTISSRDAISWACRNASGEACSAAASR